MVEEMCFEDDEEAPNEEQLSLGLHHRSASPPLLSFLVVLESDSHLRRIQEIDLLKVRRDSHKL